MKKACFMIMPDNELDMEKWSLMHSIDKTTYCWFQKMSTANNFDDDVLSLNISKLSDSIDLIYPHERDIKDITDFLHSARPTTWIQQSWLITHA